MNVSQIYDGEDDPVEMKIELDKAANEGGLRKPKRDEDRGDKSE